MNIKLLLTTMLLINIFGCNDKNMEGEYIVTEIQGVDVSEEGITLNVENNYGIYRVNGNNSCNTYMADVEIDNKGMINVGPAMATKMYCADKASLEKNYMTQLANIKKFKLKKNNLRLKNEAGEVIVVAKVKPEEEDDK